MVLCPSRKTPPVLSTSVPKTSVLKTPLIAAVPAIAMMLAQGGSLQAQPIPGFTDQPAPAIRVGAAETVVYPGTLTVPIFAENFLTADGAHITLDFDPAFLVYAWYTPRNKAWRMERAQPYGEQRTIFLLRRLKSIQEIEGPIADEDDLDFRTPPVDTPVHIVDVTFYVKPYPQQAGETPPFVRSTRITLGPQAAPGEPGSDSYLYRDQTGAGFKSVPTRLWPNEARVYYQDGVEAGSAAATNAPQKFTIPIYLTSIRPEQKTFLVGVDYDELFLRVEGVEGVGPTIRTAPAESLSLDEPDRVSFRVEIEPKYRDAICRLHVANLVLDYSGGAEVGEDLEFEPHLLGGTATAGGGAAAREAAGGPYGGSVLGSVEILEPHFVRGNIDSSSQTRSDGIRTYNADLTDAHGILVSIFFGAGDVGCMDAADVNDNGAVDVSDVICILNHLYRAGPPPARPYPYPGLDPSDDGFDCAQPVPIFQTR